MKVIDIVLLTIMVSPAFSQSQNYENNKLETCELPNNQIVEYLSSSRNSAELEIRSMALSTLITYCPVKADSVLHMILDDTTWSNLDKIKLAKNNLPYISGSTKEPLVRNLLDSTSQYVGLDYYEYLTELDSARNVKYQLALEHDPDIFTEIFKDLMRTHGTNRALYKKLDITISLINLGDDVLEDSLINVINSAAKSFYALTFKNEVVKRMFETRFEGKVFEILRRLKTSNSIKRTLYLLDKYDNRADSFDVMRGTTASSYFGGVLVHKAAEHLMMDQFFIFDLYDEPSLAQDMHEFIAYIKEIVNTDPTIWNSDIRNNINYDRDK